MEAIIEREEQEVWIDCARAQGYQVSNLGRVRFFKTNNNAYKPGHIMGQQQTNGFYFAVLSVGNKRRWLSLGRLILEGFAPRPDMERLVVGYVDKDPSNLRLENLKWQKRQAGRVRKTPAKVS